VRDVHHKDLDHVEEVPWGPTVAVLTSSGLKDPETTQKQLPPIEVAEPTLDGLRAFPREQYMFDVDAVSVSA